MRRRRGQTTVEYMLLLCSAVTLALIAGAFLQRYGPELVEKVLDKVLDAVLTLAMP